MCTRPVPGLLDWVERSSVSVAHWPNSMNRARQYWFNDLGQSHAQCPSIMIRPTLVQSLNLLSGSNDTKKAAQPELTTFSVACGRKNLITEIRSS